MQSIFKFFSFLLFGVLTIQAQISRFEHVVIIVQENRTPDNLFQGLCSAPYGSAANCSVMPTGSQYNIQTANWANKKVSTAITQPGPVPLANHYDLSHAHRAFTNMCDANAMAAGVCKMDGAAGVSCGGKCPASPQFKYVDNTAGTLNPHLDLATQYGWANYMFQTNQGPSFPAHQFLFGGTSAASASDDAAGVFAAENMSNTGITGNAAVAGCIANSNTVVQLVRPPGTETPGDTIPPCFEHQTMGDFQSVFSWRYYAPGKGSIWTAPNAIAHICQSTGPGGDCIGPDWKNNVDLTPSNVLTDIGACQLRQVSWVIPSGQNSDHANINDGGGPSWVAQIVNALGQSNSCDGNKGYWNNTAVLITWDDWGGWYDHEPPPLLAQPQGSYQLGFRVPLIAVSAYTPKGYVNNIPHDFGSILRFVQHNFGITEGALNFADARASTDLGLFFDLTKQPRSFQQIRAAKSAAFFLRDKRKMLDPDDQ